MFEGQKRGGAGDVVLESRHLIGLFLIFVVMSGLFFTLGWVMRGSQQDAQADGMGAGGDVAPSNPSGATTRPTTDAKPLSDVDMYRAAKAKPRVERPGKTPPAGAGKTSPALPLVTKNAPGQSRALLKAPLIPRGSIVLQVAAVTKEQDALALAQALQAKNFPSYVLKPVGDSYYRVQVGPYADQQSANQARRGLEQQGFKAIVKR